MLCDIMCLKLSFLITKGLLLFFGLGWVVDWVGSVICWVGLRWVEEIEIGPTDNSEVRRIKWPEIILNVTIFAEPFRTEPFTRELIAKRHMA